MRLRLLIIPALMATALFAQGPGGFRRGQANGTNAPTTTPTPPTPATLATRELNMIATFLGLTPTQTSSLSAALGSDLLTEQDALQVAASSLQAAYTKLASDIGTANVTTDLGNISSAIASSVSARVTAAGEVLTALETANLSSSLTPAKQAGLVRMLVGGGLGGPGGFRGGPRF